MSIVKLLKANCKNCYKCVRHCPVKAIKIKDYQAQIMEDLCIMCGTCVKVCPQHAKYVRNDVYNVEVFMRTGQKIVVSLAPSFVMMHPKPNKVVGALKKLGFDYVEETSVGAAMVSEKYAEIVDEGMENTVISSCCPTIVELIQVYYPELLDKVAPVVSPMMAHGKAIRKKYGRDVKIVFIGPCIAKKGEIEDLQGKGIIDEAITFEEVEEWLEREGICLDDCEEVPFDNPPTGKNRFYPMPGGVLKSMDKGNNLENYMAVDGLEECIRVLNELRHGDLKNGLFIEMNSCRGGCMNGPASCKHSKGYFGERDKLIHFSQNVDCELDMQAQMAVGIERNYTNKSIEMPEPTEYEIQLILNKIGKTDPSKEYNCGACGYNSCREKARAVYQNKAELTMCLPYMKERAESISNIVILSTPNAVVAVNEKYEVLEFNPAAEKFFDVKKSEVYGKNILQNTEFDDFFYVKEYGEDIIHKKKEYQKLGKIGEVTIVYLEEEKIMLGLVVDITAQEKKNQSIMNLKEETIKMAQEVIDKQMFVAQQIAGLLGETTAETKATLTKMKKVVEGEEV